MASAGQSRLDETLALGSTKVGFGVLVLVLEDLVAIEGVLESFVRLLQTLQTLRERLQSVVGALRFQCSGLPNPLVGYPARVEEGTRANGRISRLAPRVSIICLKLRASASSNASVAFGLTAEVLLAGPARPPTLLPFRARNEPPSGVAGGPPVATDGDAPS